MRLKGRINNCNLYFIKIYSSHASLTISSNYTFKKNFMAPFYGWGSTTSRLQSNYEEEVYFLPQSSQKFLVLIWSTLEEWNCDLTLEPLSGFEHRTSGLGINCFNHSLGNCSVYIKIYWSFFTLSSYHLQGIIK